MDFRNPIEEESNVTGFDGTNCICVRNRTGASMVQVEVDTGNQIWHFKLAASSFPRYTICSRMGLFFFSKCSNLYKFAYYFTKFWQICIVSQSVLSAVKYDPNILSLMLFIAIRIYFLVLLIV